MGKVISVHNYTNKNINLLELNGDKEGQNEVTLFSKEGINFYKTLDPSIEINYGDFNENLTIEGLNYSDISLLDRFEIGEVVLEVIKIGYNIKKGKFKNIKKPITKLKDRFICKVLKFGIIKPNDIIKHIKKTILISIVTLNDKIFLSQKENLSGEKLIHTIEKSFLKTGWQLDIKITTHPLNPDMIKPLFLQSLSNKVDLLFLLGGTGIGPKDLTSETIYPLLDKKIPGIIDYLNGKYGGDKPEILLHRAISGITNKMITYCLPSSLDLLTIFVNEIIKSLEYQIMAVNGVEISNII